jgi:hypothetical protein
MIDEIAPRAPVSVDEYAPAFAGYVARLAADEDVMDVMTAQLTEVSSRWSMPEARGDYRYAPGKWTIKEVLGHLCDAERVFAYRALRISRGDSTPLPSFDQDAYVLELHAGARTLADLAAEWADVRRASIALFAHLPAAAWARRGLAGNTPVTVRALAYIIAGHVRHHLEGLAARYGA